PAATAAPPRTPCGNPDPRRHLIGRLPTLAEGEGADLRERRGSARLVKTATSITLYNFEISSRCYKARLFLTLLKLDYEQTTWNNSPAFEHRKPEFLRINPLGQLPAMRDGDLMLRDAQAMVTYLARKYDPAARWLPAEPGAFGEVMMWLFFAA